MGFFNKKKENIGKVLGELDSISKDIKKILDTGKAWNADEPQDALNHHKEEFLKKFQEFEELEVRKHVLEDKTNTLMHELLNAFKFFNEKNSRLEIFERELDKHFENIENQKKKIIEAIDSHKFNKQMYDEFVKSLEFLWNGFEKERKEEFDVMSQLEESKKKIEKLIDNLN